MLGRADLTIWSSDPDVVAIDQPNAVFIGKEPGHAEIRTPFSEAAAIVLAFLTEPKVGLGGGEVTR